MSGYDKSTSLDRYTEFHTGTSVKLTGRENLDIENTIKILKITSMGTKGSGSIEGQKRFLIMTNKIDTVKFELPFSFSEGDCIEWVDGHYVHNGEIYSSEIFELRCDRGDSWYQTGAAATINFEIPFDPCYRYEENLSGKMIVDKRKELDNKEDSIFLASLEGEGKRNYLSEDKQTVEYILNPYHRERTDSVNPSLGVFIENTAENTDLYLNSIEAEEGLVEYKNNNYQITFNTKGSNLYSYSKDEYNLTGTSTPYQLNQNMYVKQGNPYTQDCIIKTNGDWHIEKMSPSQSLYYQLIIKGLVPNYRYVIAGRYSIETESEGFMGNVFNWHMNLVPKNSEYRSYEFTTDANGDSTHPLVDVTGAIRDLKIRFEEFYIVEKERFISEQFELGMETVNETILPANIETINNNKDKLFWDLEYNKYRILNNTVYDVAFNTVSSEFIEPQKLVNAPIENFNTNLLMQFKGNVDPSSTSVRVSYSRDGVNKVLATLSNLNPGQELEVMLLYRENDNKIILRANNVDRVLTDFSANFTVHGLRGLENIQRIYTKDLILHDAEKIRLGAFNGVTRINANNSAPQMEFLAYSHELKEHLEPDTYYSLNWRVVEETMQNSRVSFDVAGNSDSPLALMGVASIKTPSDLSEYETIKIGGDFGLKITDLILVKGEYVRCLEFFSDSFNLLGEEAQDGYDVAFKATKDYVEKEEKTNIINLPSGSVADLTGIKIKNNFNYISGNNKDITLGTKGSMHPTTGEKRIENVLCYREGEVFPNYVMWSRTFVQTSINYHSETVTIDNENPFAVEANRIHCVHGGETLCFFVDEMPSQTVELELVAANDETFVYKTFTIDSSYNNKAKMLKTSYVQGTTNYTGRVLKGVKIKVKTPGVTLRISEVVTYLWTGISGYSDKMFPRKHLDGIRSNFDENNSNPIFNMYDSVTKDLVETKQMTLPEDFYFMRLYDCEDRIFRDRIDKRVEKFVIEGNHRWRVRTDRDNEYIMFRMEDYRYDTHNLYWYGWTLCENPDFSTIRGDSQFGYFEGIQIQNSESYGFSVCIRKDRLETLDSDGLNKWLNKNPLTVYYLLETPQSIKNNDSQISYFNPKRNKTYDFESVGDIPSTFHIRTAGVDIDTSALPNKDYVLYWDYKGSNPDELLYVTLGHRDKIGVARLGAEKLIINGQGLDSSSISFAGKPGEVISNVMLLNKESHENMKPKYFKGLKIIGREPIELKLNGNTKKILNLKEDLISMPSLEADEITNGILNKKTMKAIITDKTPFMGTYHGDFQIGLIYHPSVLFGQNILAMPQNLLCEDYPINGDSELGNNVYTAHTKIYVYNDGRIGVFIPKINVTNEHAFRFNYAKIVGEWLSKNPITIYATRAESKSMSLVKDTMIQNESAVNQDFEIDIFDFSSTIESISISSFNQKEEVFALQIPLPLEAGEKLKWSNEYSKYYIESDSGVTYLQSNKIGISKESLAKGIGNYKLTDFALNCSFKEKKVYEVDEYNYVKNHSQVDLQNVDKQQKISITKVAPSIKQLGQKMKTNSGQPILDPNGNSQYSFSVKGEVGLPIKDGLALWFDANDGTESQTSWRDRISGVEMTLFNFDFNGANGWDDGKLVFSGRQYCKISGLNRSMKDYTVVVSRKNSKTFKAGPSWFRTKNETHSNYSIVEYYPSSNDRNRGRFHPADDYSNDYVIDQNETFLAMSVNVTKSEFSTYQGNKKLYSRPNSTVLQNQTWVDMTFADGNPYGELYYVLVYDRVLSDEELLILKDYDTKRGGAKEEVVILPKPIKNGNFPLEGKKYQEYLEWDEDRQKYYIKSKKEDSDILVNPVTIEGLMVYTDCKLVEQDGTILANAADESNYFKIQNPYPTDYPVVPGQGIHLPHDKGNTSIRTVKNLQGMRSMVLTFKLRSDSSRNRSYLFHGSPYNIYIHHGGYTGDWNPSRFYLNGEFFSYSYAKIPANEYCVLYLEFSRNLDVGCAIFGTHGAEFFDGEIYSYRAYNRPLTVEEIQNITNYERNRESYYLEKATSTYSQVESQEFEVNTIKDKIGVVPSSDSFQIKTFDPMCEIDFLAKTKTLNPIEHVETPVLEMLEKEDYKIKWTDVKQARNYSIYVNDILVEDVKIPEYRFKEFEGNVFIYASNELSSMESDQSYIKTSPLAPASLQINSDSTENAYSFNVTFVDKSQLEDGFRVKYQVDEEAWQILEIEKSEETDEQITCNFAVTDINKCIKIQVVSYNDIGENDIIPISTYYTAHIKEWTYLLNSASVLVVFDDNLDNETAYKVKYIKSSDAIVNKNTIVTDGEIGQEYQYAFGLSPTDEATVSICPIVDGVESLYSKTKVVSKSEDKTLTPPQGFRYEWIGPGLLRFYWEDIYNMEQGFEFSYFTNRGDEKIVRIPSNSIETTGTEYYYDIQLNQTDNIVARARMYWRLNQSEYTNTIDVTFHPVTGEPVEYVRKSRNSDGGIVIDWQRQSYVENYELDYSIGEERKTILTKDNSAAIQANYLDNAEVEVKVRTHFSGGVTSDYSNSLNWSITGKEVQQENITYDVVRKDTANQVMTYDKTKFLEDLHTASTTKNNKSSEYLSSTHISADKSKHDYEITTWLNQGRVSYDNNSNIVTPTKTDNGIFDEMVYIPRTITTVDEMFVRTAIKREYEDNMDISKVRIATIGDSITSGHPGYYAETGNGDERSQYQYWLNRRLKNAYEIVNKGYGSDRSWQILARFEKDILPLEPAYCLIQGGTNDLYQAMGEANGNQDVLDTYLEGMKNNMRTMVQICKDNNIRPIVGTLIPRTGALGIYQTALYDFNDWIIKTYSADPDADYVDFFNAGKDFIPPTPLEHPEVPGAMNPAYDGDTEFDEYGNITVPGPGIHPSMEGYKIMGNSIPLSLFILSKTELGMYLDRDCTVKDNFDGSDSTKPVYKMKIGTLRRGRIKTVVRYIKNNGDKEIVFSMYANDIEGCDLVFADENGVQKTYASGRLAPGRVQQVVVHLLAHEDKYSVDLDLYMTAREISEKYEE